MYKTAMIEKVENGYTVTFNWTEKNEKGEDYKSQEWIFETKEEAIAKVEAVI